MESVLSFAGKASVQLMIGMLRSHNFAHSWCESVDVLSKLISRRLCVNIFLCIGTPETI